MNSAREPESSRDRPVALVTGAGRRVGNAIARALAARGDRVALHASRSLAEAEATAKELRAGGADAIAIQADLRDEDATRAMVASVRDTFGRIDALVNNASVWSAKRLEDLRSDDLRRQFEVNTLATFVCCQAAGLAMVEQPTGGAIVNVGDWAIARPYVDYAHYFATKGSIPSLTRAMAVELATLNPRVRVNAVLPGPVLFPQGLSETQRAESIDATLVKRAGTPEDLAHAVLFLLENTFVTGVCLPVDGGRTIYAPPGSG
jgi:pteridine reductase